MTRDKDGKMQVYPGIAGRVGQNILAAGTVRQLADGSLIFDLNTEHYGLLDATIKEKQDALYNMTVFLGSLNIRASVIVKMGK